MRRPNFFILGAARCGTTTLYHILRQHEQIFMSEVKEPSFFCSYFQVVKNPIDYFNLFEESGGAIAVGEASHLYLSNPETPKVLHSLFPDAKFIVILRNPVNRAYSLYNWIKRREAEPCETFSDAVEMEDIRFHSKRFFNKCRPHYFWNFMYVRSSYYHKQLNRYLELYGKERFFILSLQDLSNDPHKWIEDIYSFLGVDTSFRPVFIHRNKAKYEPMDLEIREFLDEHFKDTVFQTEKIVGRELHLDGI